MPQRGRVMWAQILDVGDFEAGARDLVDYLRQMRQRAAGKHKAVDELAAGRALRRAVAVARRDTVIERRAARLQQSCDRLEIQRQIGDADMLVHADRDDLVEAAALRHIAIILTAD